MQNPITNSKAIRGATLQGGAMTVYFTSGSSVTCLDVDERVYCELLSAASPGRYYCAEIRGCYETQKGTP